MIIKDLGPGLNGYVIVGKVIDAHGIKGEVKVLPHSGTPDDFRNYPSLILADVDIDNGSIMLKKEFAVLKNRGQGKVAVLQIEGVTDRSGAEDLQGRNILVHRATLPKLPAGHYYWHEIHNADVIDTSGRHIGTIDALLVTRAHPILVICEGEKEYLVPAEDEFIRSVDISNQVVQISPPPGLLEMNETQ